MYPVDSGLFVARWYPRNKHVDHSVNVPLSEQQLDYVHVSEMKEFSKQLLTAYVFSSLILYDFVDIFDFGLQAKNCYVTAFVDVFTYVFDCLSYDEGKIVNLPTFVVLPSFTTASCK